MSWRIEYPRGRLGGMLVAFAVLCSGPVLPAAPFAETISFTQPDGTTIQLWGEGNEFYAIFETLDATRSCFDPASGAYQYARLSDDGSELIPVEPRQARATRRRSARQALADLRPRQAAPDRAARPRMGPGHGNNDALGRAARQLSGPGGSPPGRDRLWPASAPTLGTKVGLTLLVDFDDDPATVSRTAVDAFCNGDDYTSYGNNGSVKQYFRDVSMGRSPTRTW